MTKGKPSLDDALMIEHLIHDNTFIESMEETLGKVTRIYPDWVTGHLIYELLDGNIRESKIEPILENLRRSNYLKEFEH